MTIDSKTHVQYVQAVDFAVSVAELLDLSENQALTPQWQAFMLDQIKQAFTAKGLTQAVLNKEKLAHHFQTDEVKG